MIVPKLCLKVRSFGSLFNLTTISLVKTSVRNMSSAAVPLDSIPKVDIDSSGVFKYILLRVYDKKKEEEAPVVIVRGYRHCNYHSDIYDEVQEKLYPLECEVLGGVESHMILILRELKYMAIHRDLEKQTMRLLQM